MNQNRQDTKSAGQEQATRQSANGHAPDTELDDLANASITTGDNSWFTTCLIHSNPFLIALSYLLDKTVYRNVKLREFGGEQQER